MNLLPKHHDEFQSKEYWDSFFAQRGDEAFEWYGGYQDLRPHCLRQVSPHDKLLMLGCGNSSFSADLYDDGFRDIVNVDFSETLIANMRAQNQEARPRMSWEVMDMTALAFADESFDAVLDKGALDALMSVNEPQLLRKAADMFAHIARVLVPGGKYLCVSLCEDYIAAHMMRSLLEVPASFGLSMEVVTPTTPSPFKPFFLAFSKPKSGASSSAAALPVQAFFNSFGSPTKTPASLSPAATADLIARAHACNQKRFQLSRVEPGRYELFDVHTEEQTAPSLEGEGPLPPRFSIIIFDHAARAARTCAVFFVPPGRETDYQFTSPSGLADLATQAQCRRLLAVRCNRPHVFPPMADLQSELSPLAMHLAPADIGPPAEDPIPFMAVQEQSDWETISKGELPVVGAFVVEEMGAEDESSDKHVWRRLLFLQNQHFVQTEAKVLNPAHSRKSKSSSSKKKKGTKGKGKGGAPKQSNAGSGGGSGAGGEELFLFDHSYLDDHHKAMLAALLCDNTDIISVGAQSRAGVAQTATLDHSEGVSALLVGLGGGALAMALQRYLPSLHLDVVELVPGLDEVATQHFGFVAGPRCRTLVGDGVQFVMQQGGELQASSASTSVFEGTEVLGDSGGGRGRGRYHSVLLDVDSKDNSLGVSAPPASFLTPSFLQHLHDRVLLPGGSLCINVVARDKGKLADLVAQLNAVFGAGGMGGAGVVYCIKPSSETVNLTVHAVKGGTAALNPCGLAKQIQALTVSLKNSKSKKAGSSHHGTARTNAAAAKARARGLDDWLSNVSNGNDPLGLGEVVDLIVEA